MTYNGEFVFSPSHCMVTIRPLTNLATHMKTIHYFDIYNYVFISFRRSTHKSTCRSWSSWPWLTTNAKLELSGFITVNITSVVIISKFFAACHTRGGLRWRVTISSVEPRRYLRWFNKNKRGLIKKVHSMYMYEYNCLSLTWSLTVFSIDKLI